MDFTWRRLFSPTLRGADMFRKIIGHPLFLYVVFIYLLFAMCSHFAAAQTSGVPNSSGTWTPWSSGTYPDDPACTSSKGVPLSSPHYESAPGAGNRTTCYVLTGGSACQSGYSWNQETFSCEGAPPPICVPPDVDLGNGECGLPQCGEGYFTQGHINGQPICQLDCTPYGGGSPGFFNGVEGCYGGEGPSCPEGTWWGQVDFGNGPVSGCWGDGSSGGSNSSSGGANSSAGGGSGSSSGGGDNGGGGDGSGYEGTPYDPSEPCPSGYEKTANNTCEGQGDCYPGYHSVVISQSPFYAMCMPDQLPSSSSSSSQSSSPPSSSSSSSESSSPTGGGSGSSSGGGGSSSGSGGGGGTGDGEEMEFSGECDPTSADYFDCISPSGDMPAHTETDSGATTFAQVNQNFFNALSQTGPIVAMSNMANFVDLADPACPVFSMDLSDTPIGRTISTDIHCTLWQVHSGTLSVVMIAVWVFAAFRIFASA